MSNRDNVEQLRQEADDDERDANNADSRGQHEIAATLRRMAARKRNKAEELEDKGYS